MKAKGPSKKGRDEDANVLSEDDGPEQISSGEQPDAPLTEEEIRQLPVPAMVALAARCAMRVQPLFVPWQGQRDSADALRAVDSAVTIAALAAITPGRTLGSASAAVRAAATVRTAATVRAAARGGLFNVYNAADEAADAAAYAAYAAYAADVADAAYATYAANTRAARAASSANADAARAARAADAAAAGAAARGDYGFLTGNSAGTRELFDRPLWATGEPPDWSQILVGWHEALERVGLHDIAVSYDLMFSGKGFDWAGAEKRVSAWCKSQGLEWPESVGTEAPAEDPEQTTSEPVSSPDATATGSLTAPTSKADAPATRDLLDRGTLVDALAAMFAAKEQSTPFTFALLGDWGAGKSSVMEQVEDRLRRLRDGCLFYFARFNAWEFEQTDNLRAALAQEMVKGLLEVTPWYKKTWFRFRFACREHCWEVVKGCGLLFLAAVAAGSTLWSGLAEGWAQGAGGLLGVGVTVGVWVFAQEVWKGLRPILEHPISANLVACAKLPDYSEQLGQIPVIKRHLKILCEFVGVKKGANKRLVVFVDDLDRCGSKCIVETLDAARLVMDIPNAIVVFAIDDRIALRAVANHYAAVADESRDKYEVARDYLCKIIQVCVKLPKADPESFIDDYLFAGARPSPNPPPPTGEKDTTPNAVEEQAPIPPDPEQNVDTKGAFLHDISTERKGPPPSEGTSGDALLAEPATDTDPDQTDNRPLIDMSDTEAERESFRRWTDRFRFTNPRQLIRLRNTYRLVKALDGKRDPERLMAMLFWLEFMSSCGAEDRGAYEGKLLAWDSASADPYATRLAEIGIREALLTDGTFDEKAYAAEKEYAGLFTLPYGQSKRNGD